MFAIFAIGTVRTDGRTGARADGRKKKFGMKTMDTGDQKNVTLVSVRVVKQNLSE